jgi:hypothetical protein
MKISDDILMTALRNAIKSKDTKRAIWVAREILSHRSHETKNEFLRSLPVLQCEYSLLTPHVKGIVDLMELYSRRGQDNIRPWTAADDAVVIKYVGLIATLPRDLDVFISLVNIKYDRELVPEPDTPDSMKWLGALQVRAMSGGSRWDGIVMKVTLNVWANRVQKQIEPIREWAEKAEEMVDDIISWMVADPYKFVVGGDDLDWTYDNHKIPFTLLRKLPKNMTEGDFRRMWWWYRTAAYEGVWFFLGTFITDKSCSWESIMESCRAFPDMLETNELWKGWMKPKIAQMIAQELISLRDYVPQINVTTTGWEIQSQSNPKKYYQVEKKDETYSCNCEASKYHHRRCKHIDYILEHVTSKGKDNDKART